MGSPRRSHDTARFAGNADDERLSPNRSSALEENVQAIKRWERAILLARSKVEQVSDWIACTAGSGPVLVLHVVWFGAWVTVNAPGHRGHLDVRTTVTPEQLGDLIKKTDLRRLTNRMEELAEPVTPTASTATASGDRTRC